MPKKLTIEEIKEIAKAHGCILISKEYFSSHLLLDWKCSKGHEFKASFRRIQGRKTWCKVCTKSDVVKNLEIEIKKQIKNHNGKLLKGDFKTRSSRLFLKCEAGHKWETSLKSVLEGCWCKSCSYQSQRLPLSYFKELAIQKGGECLSTEYHSSMEKLTFRCAKGHEWSTRPSVVKSGHWCQRCSIKNSKKEMDERRKKYYEFANYFGGQLVSMTVGNITSNLEWKCDKGHLFVATPRSLKLGKGCPLCKKAKAREEKKEKASQIIAEKGGCASFGEIYEREDRVNITCENGHIWSPTIRSILNGAWCRKCYFNKSKGSIEEFQQIAKSRGGECLSTEYVNSITRLKFRCSKGHEWESRGNNIKSGTWCFRCARSKDKG